MFINMSTHYKILVFNIYDGTDTLQNRNQILCLWRDDLACSDHAAFIRAVNRNVVCSHCWTEWRMLRKISRVVRTGCGQHHHAERCGFSLCTTLRTHTHTFTQLFLLHRMALGPHLNSSLKQIAFFCIYNRHNWLPSIWFITLYGCTVEIFFCIYENGKMCCTVFHFFVTNTIC